MIDGDRRRLRTKRTARPRPSVEPRLLSDEQAADYLGASPSYVRALVSRGVIKRVGLPATSCSGERARKLLVEP
jgi:hypothetical protein